MGDASAAKQDEIKAAIQLYQAQFTTTIGTFIWMVETKFDLLRAGQTITEIDSILNITVGDATWEAITVPAAAGSACKAIAATLLTETVWHFSHESDGDPSIKVDGVLTLDIVKGVSDVIGYAQTDSGADTLQVVLLK